MRHVLGISAFFHDSSAVLLGDGQILAAAQEERFSRRKNDARFPRRAVEYCLRQGGLTPAGLDAVAFYEKPILKFSRTLEVFLGLAPRGMQTFIRTLPPWLGERLNSRQTLRKSLPGLSPGCPILFPTHHESHAASAFLPSPFSSAAILTVDGVGEWATTTIGRGDGSRVELLEELRFPHSLGLLYSAFTAYCGFRVNSGEYKLMGLAPYGEPTYAETIRQRLLKILPDGSFRLDPGYFNFLAEDHLTNHRFHALFGGPPRLPEAPLERRHLDLARSIQAVTEDAILGLARRAHAVTGERNLCLAGGVALNCVANGRLLREGPFESLWIQPAAGDAGGALGAALTAWHAPMERGGLGAARTPATPDAMQGAFLGPEFSDAEIECALRQHQAVFERLTPESMLERTASALAAEQVVGWVQGRMEFGPRALGHRSILGDPRSPRMQSVMNLKVKFRESFRPFAPAVREHRAAEYFDLETTSPYMLLVAQIHASQRLDVEDSVTGLDRLKQLRSRLPAITHVDGSARVQTVSAADNPQFDALLRRFEELTGCPVLINTSFNVRGEPIVCSPDDAYRCFINCQMDALVIGNFYLERSAQPHTSLPGTFEALPD
jgi:carbamoyltransferase